MCFTVNGEMQLTPDTAAFLAMLFDFPLAFTEDLQPGGINYQVCDFTPGGRFETDINGVSLDIENYCTLGSFFDHQ